MEMIKNKIFLLIVWMTFTPFLAMSQYAPQAGNFGSTAIHRDSSIIKTFANFYPGSEGKSMLRGWANINDTSLGKVSVGNIDSISFTPDFFMLSLGDGGSVTIKLPTAITNGIGPDFAIFENGFSFSKDSFFLELAFVEVSTDGQNFIRFPAFSETDTNQQIGAFGSIQAHKIHNLAGKYIMPYGVPFDLEDIKNELGSAQQIRYIRLIDVVGSINPLFASRDYNGRIINDPWPTPFPSGGFDLTGIGFIHGNFNYIDKEFVQQPDIQIFPNPLNKSLPITINSKKDFSNIQIKDIRGIIKQELNNVNQNYLELNLSDLEAGIYLIELYGDHFKPNIHKLIVYN